MTEKSQKARKPRGHKRTGKPRGRPEKVLDVQLLNSLAEIGCTREEMALVVGVHPSTLSRRNYASMCEKGKALYKVSLRRSQKKLADQLNPTMLVWLGKQELGQVDKVEQLTKGDVKHTYVIEFDTPLPGKRRPEKVEDDEEEDAA